MTEPYDVVVRGGTVVTADGRGEADVGVRDGRIAQLGGPMAGRRELDARGAWVLPGGLDMHVHFAAVAPGPGDPAGFVDDFTSGSRAAVAGGVTTYGNMSLPDDDQQNLATAVARDEAAADAGSVTDYVLHPGVYTATPDLATVLPVLADRGLMSLKVVTLALDEDPRGLIRAVKAAGDLGMITLVHCEDGAIIDFVTDDLVETGRAGLEHYPASRPDFSESVAVDRAIAISEATGAPVCIVHLSSALALESARRARARGLPVFVETRPFYLHLTAQAHDRADAGAFVGMPPLREDADVDVLWRGLADGSIHTLASDHAPWFLADKVDESLDVRTCRKVAEIETMIPMLYDAGVAKGRLSLERMVAVTSTNAARLNGLYPRKGTVAVGADADLTVLDPGIRRVVDASRMQSRADYCVYDGREVAGWPRFTVSRGDVVVEDGEVTGSPGRGLMIPARPDPGAVSLDGLLTAAGLTGWVHAVDIDTGDEVGIDPDSPVVAASVFKVPVLVELCRQAAAGEVDLCRRVRVARSEHRTPGGTGTAVMLDAWELSVRDTALLMMSISDNRATDVVMDLVGIDRVNTTMTDAGLPGTQLVSDCAGLFAQLDEDLGGSFESYLDQHPGDPLPAGVRAVTPLSTNRTTPRETTTLLSRLWRDEPGGPEVCAEVRRILGLQVWPHRLGSGSPSPGSA